MSRLPIKTLVGIWIIIVKGLKMRYTIWKKLINQ